MIRSVEKFVAFSININQVIMKILWLSHFVPYPPKGGVLQRGYNLIKEIARYHQVDLLAFNQPDLIGPLFTSVEEGLKEANEILGRICRRHAFFEIPACRNQASKYFCAIKSLFNAPYNISWLKSDDYADAIRLWCQKYDYDLVHFDTISFIPFYTCVNPKTATVLDHHNIESHMLLRRAKKAKNPLKSLYFLQEGKRLQKFEKRFCPKFSLNITCSDVDTHRLRSIAPMSNVKTIPNGVDLDYFSPTPLTHKEKRLIFVGTLSWYPNIEAVLYIANNLWPLLKELEPDLHIDIIGANPPNAVVEIAKRDPTFHVHGFVEDVRPYFDQSTVYVCPIRDGGGTKLKILDAMAMEKAIVCHPVACEGISVIPGKHLHFAESDLDFVNKICHLLHNQMDCIKMGQNARELVRNSYNYDTLGWQLNLEINKIYKGKPAYSTV